MKKMIVVAFALAALLVTACNVTIDLGGFSLTDRATGQGTLIVTNNETYYDYYSMRVGVFNGASTVFGSDLLWSPNPTSLTNGLSAKAYLNPGTYAIQLRQQTNGVRLDKYWYKTNIVITADTTTIVTTLSVGISSTSTNLNF